MKKVLCLILFVVLSFTLFGCNRQLFDTKYSFETVHIYETGKCYEIKSWRDYDDSDQLQFVLKDDTVIVIHSTDCSMIKGTCPFCKDQHK